MHFHLSIPTPHQTRQYVASRTLPVLRNISLAMAIIFGPAFAISMPAFAKVSVKVSTHYYNISGITSDELKQQMALKGPENYWAYARWWVEWNIPCSVSVKLDYTFPRWINKKDAPKALQENWASMMAALVKHELTHGQHGIKAAKEIEEDNCENDPMMTIKKWAKQDKIFDLNTKHGRAFGVILP